MTDGAPRVSDLLREQLSQQRKALLILRVMAGASLVFWVGAGLLLWQARPDRSPPTVVTLCPPPTEVGVQDDALPVVAVPVEDDAEDDAVRATATARASLLRVLGDRAMKVRHVSLSGPEFLRATQGVDTRTRVLPVELDGGKAGLKLLRLPSGGYWDLMGMRAGDVIVALNGYGMRDPRTAMQAHVEMMRAQHGVFELERDGERYALSVRWDD